MLLHFQVSDRYQDTCSGVGGKTQSCSQGSVESQWTPGTSVPGPVLSMATSVWKDTVRDDSSLWGCVEDSKFLSMVLQGDTWDLKGVPIGHMALRDLVTPRVVLVVNKQFILGPVQGHNVAAHKNLVFGQSYFIKLLKLIISIFF